MTILGELINTELRISEHIRIPGVRPVGPKGEQVGIVRLEDAPRLAVESDFDLAEAAPQAHSPVAKLMGYGKFKYEVAWRTRDVHRNQSSTITKEMKPRLKIDDHDYETKRGHVVRLLKASDKAKITIIFRGWEQSRPKLGIGPLKRLASDAAEHGFVESVLRQGGRNILMILGPTRKKTGTRVEQAEERGRRMERRGANAEAEKAEEARLGATARPSKKGHDPAGNMNLDIDP